MLLPRIPVRKVPLVPKFRVVYASGDPAGAAMEGQRRVPVRTESARQAANRSEPRRIVESFWSRSFDAGARGAALT